MNKSPLISIYLPHFASVEGYEIIGVEQVHKTGKSLVFVVDREEVLYQ
jgi:hypothetical protein